MINLDFIQSFKSNDLSRLMVNDKGELVLLTVVTKRKEKVTGMYSNYATRKQSPHFTDESLLNTVNPYFEVISRK